MTKKQTVFVGLSGGVDSSVAADRLIKQGYNVVGVFIKVWQPDFLECNWEQERLDAMRVAAHLDIPFLTCDAEAVYKSHVADYFISEYKAGRTPNPDVLCNKEVKFGAFLNFALERGADYIATGHYVQKINNQLHRGVDTEKDQSYFLWSLSSEQLSRSLFPVGSSTKKQIRQEARALKLPTAVKKDSQGVCFLGHINIPEFLSHYVDLVPGPVLSDSGEVIGEHKGALVYTLGQRHGFTYTDINSERSSMFVIAKDVDKNTITVSNKPALVQNKKIELTQTVFRNEISEDEVLNIQFRYRQTPLKAKIYTQDGLTYLQLIDTAELPAPGQSCVIYQGSLCIGGGIK